MSVSTNIFAILNCFNNYEICAQQVILNYITNAINGMSPEVMPSIKTFFNDTPYLFYCIYLDPGSVLPGLNASKQYQDFITIFCLTCVCLARVAQSDITIMARQDMLVLPGFALLYDIANQLNKNTVYWTDDLRNIFGTSDDPLVIGMAPLPYRYLWSASNKEGEDISYQTQPKGLNGPFTFPNLAGNVDLCPKIDKTVIEQNWNTFINLIKQGQNIQSQNTAATLNKRTNDLITIGDAIITYVEITKKNDPNLKKYGYGWDLSNTTLWWDMEAVVKSNKNLLYKQEQEFIMMNTAPMVNLDMVSNKLKFSNPFKQMGKTNVARVISEGLRSMMFKKSN